MRRLTKSLARACAVTLAAALLAASAHAIDVTQNRAAEGAIAAQQSKPLLLVFTQPGCPYCERARAQYLRHLAVAPAYTARAIFRADERIKRGIHLSINGVAAGLRNSG